jgi:hypothetical protein
VSLYEPSPRSPAWNRFGAHSKYDLAKGG